MPIRKIYSVGGRVAGGKVSQRGRALTNPWPALDLFGKHIGRLGSRGLADGRAVVELGPLPARRNHLFEPIRVSCGCVAQGDLGAELVSGAAVD